MSSSVGLIFAGVVGVAACALVVGIFLGARLVRPAVADREHGSHAQESKLLVVATLLRELATVIRSLEDSRRCARCKDATKQFKPKPKKSGR